MCHLVAQLDPARVTSFRLLALYVMLVLIIVNKTKQNKNNKANYSSGLQQQEVQIIHYVQEAPILMCLAADLDKLVDDCIS